MLEKAATRRPRGRAPKDASVKEVQEFIHVLKEGRPKMHLGWPIIIQVQRAAMRGLRRKAPKDTSEREQGNLRCRGQPKLATIVLE